MRVRSDSVRSSGWRPAGTKRGVTTITPVGEVDTQKDGLLDEVGRRMLTYVERQELFTVRWEVV